MLKDLDWFTKNGQVDAGFFFGGGDYLKSKLWIGKLAKSQIVMLIQQKLWLTVHKPIGEASLQNKENLSDCPS